MKKLKTRAARSEPSEDQWTTIPVTDTGDDGEHPLGVSDIQRRIESNPLGVAAEVRHELGEIQAGYRLGLYNILAKAVGIGRHYYLNYTAWKTFFGLKFFQVGKHKRKARAQHKNALRHTMNYIFDAKSKQARSRTGKYAAGLHEIMISGLPIDLVAAEIEKAGGIETLYEAYLERQAQRPRKGRKRIASETEFMATRKYCDLSDFEGSKTTDMTLSDLEEGSALDSKETELSSEGRMSRDLDKACRLDDDLDIYSDTECELTPTVKRGRDPAGRRTVELEVSLARQARFFAMEDRRNAVLHVTCLGTEEDWQRLRVRKVIWKRR